MFAGHQIVQNLLLAAGVSAILGLPSGAAYASTLPGPRLALHTGWQLQSACNLAGAVTPAGLMALGNSKPVDGSTLASSSYHPDNWIATTVPTTIVAAQAAAGTIKELFFGDNIRNLPGVDYPQGGLFSNMDMRDTSPYNCGWWFRTQFRVPATSRVAPLRCISMGSTIALTFG